MLWWVFYLHISLEDALVEIFRTLRTRDKDEWSATQRNSFSNSTDKENDGLFRSLMHPLERIWEAIGLSVGNRYDEISRIFQWRGCKVSLSSMRLIKLNKTSNQFSMMIFIEEMSWVKMKSCLCLAWSPHNCSLLFRYESDWKSDGICTGKFYSFWEIQKA